MRHRQAGQYDFWVPPGGGLEGDEDLLAGAEREVREETGLIVRAERLLYVQDLIVLDLRIHESFLRCREVGGALSLDHREPEERERLVDARFLTRADLAALDVRPAALRDVFWQGRAAGFPTTRSLGLERATACGPRLSLRRARAPAAARGSGTPPAGTARPPPGSSRCARARRRHSGPPGTT